MAGGQQDHAAERLAATHGKAIEGSAMKLLTVCALMGLGIAGVAAWQLLGDRMPALAALAGNAGDALAMGGTGARGGEFAAVPMPDGMPTRGVIIFAPANCPSDAARRADDLAQYLSERRISYVRASAAEFSNLGSREEAERAMSVMNGPIPVVYVNGKARANPRPEDVEAEYLRAGEG